MIFAFDDTQHARAFAAAVKKRYGLEGQVFASGDEIPIVNINFFDREDVEDKVFAMLHEFGGSVFAIFTQP